MKKAKRAAVLGVAVALTITGNGFSNLRFVSADGNENILSPIVITEIVPNTDNLNKMDAWEYYEIANISNTDVNLNNYNIVYNNGSKETVWASEGVDVLPAGKTMLVWVKNGCTDDKNIEDFKTYYKEKTGAELPSDGLIATVRCDGMANSGSRSMDIRTKTGKTLTTISYNAADSDNGKIDVDEAIEFEYSKDKVTAVYDKTPTPFSLSENNVTGTFGAPGVVLNPTVEVAGAASVVSGSSVKISVAESDLSLDNIVNANINIGDKSYPMTYDTDGNLTGLISANEVENVLNGKFTYTVTITDGVNVAVSEAKEVRILAADIDSSKAPELVITEILPDSSNVNGGDAYEFIEIYNNSNRDIDLKDYKLYYNYPSDNSDVIWWETNESKIIKSDDTFVFWVKNGANDSLTKEDFNNKFGTDIDDDHLIEISCGGMANGSARGLRITTNVKDDIDYVSYNMTSGVDDTTPDKSITYQNQFVDGSFKTIMTSNCSNATPGIVTDKEKPDYKAQVSVPSNKPVLTDETAQEFSNASENLTFTVNAVSDETTIKTVKLYVKYNDEADFECYNLTRTDENKFSKSKSNIDILNKKKFTYYFEASDGFNTVQTEEKTISNTDIAADAEFNIEDNQKIAGISSVIAAGNKIIIDGEDVSVKASKSINGVGKIAFDASQTDVFFKNAVAIGDNVIGILNEGTYDQWRTYVYDIDSSFYDSDSKTITVAFHAGNKANVLEHDIENNDDFILKNIRMVMPDGETLYPVSYGAKKGLGAVEHDGLDNQPAIDVTSAITSQEKEIQMGDGTSKYEILYVTFNVPESEFNAVRYLWNTNDTTDGAHTISNGVNSISVSVDNTAPEIISNIEDGKVYHNGTIEVTANDEGDGKDGNTLVTAKLDGSEIELPYEYSALTMTPGEHTLEITAIDEMGNTARKEITFKTPKESADIETDVYPANGSEVSKTPTFSITPTDEDGDEMTVTFMRGEHYELSDTGKIKTADGVSDTSGKNDNLFESNSGDGFPYETFDITLDDGIDKDTVIQAKWSGTSNNEKTFMYAYNTLTNEWDKLDAVKTTDEDKQTMTLIGEVKVENHLSDGKVKIMVQNGEGYTPTQYSPTTEAAVNVDETSRDNYSFTFAVESDTQYYNEEYEGNPNKDVDGKYQYQLDIHNWILNNRKRMNIQYMFHDGDIIDDEPLIDEWKLADSAYKMLDDANMPYGVLAGNHDVGHLSGDYSNYGTYFGENRYVNNPWYGGSYKNNRGHYDLITVDGIDFIMVYTGWGIGDEEINWINSVLAQYPERKAILNFHEYLLASGGLGEEPKRIYDEVISKNENVCMVLSGHYHNAYTRIDEFNNSDGSTRKVYSMLFDYQGLPEGGLGYMRMLHFDTKNQKMIVRTYSPSLNDYDAAESKITNAGNQFVVPNASINGEENFEISFSDLGITQKTKVLETASFDVDVFGTQVIGTVNNVASGSKAEFTWKDAPEGKIGWYAKVTDANGGLSRTGIQYVTVTNSPLPTESASPAPTSSASPTPTSSASPVPTSSASPAPTESASESPSVSPVPTNSATPGENGSFAPTNSATPGENGSFAPSNSAAPNESANPESTNSATPNESVSPAPSNSGAAGKSASPAPVNNSTQNNDVSSQSEKTSPKTADMSKTTIPLAVMAAAVLAFVGAFFKKKPEK